jgi:hypothetical protein
MREKAFIIIVNAILRNRLDLNLKDNPLSILELSLSLAFLLF